MSNTEDLRPINSDAKLVDRTALIDALHQQLKQVGNQNVMLSGPWGSGKTTVALDLLQKIHNDSSSDVRIIYFPVTELTADANPRNALIGLLLKDAKDHFPLFGGGQRKKFDIKRAMALLETVAKPVGVIAKAFAPGGGVLVGAATELTAKVVKLYADGQMKERYLTPFPDLMEDMRWLLKCIADHHGKQRILLVIDDIDRIRPEQAVSLLDSLFHLLLPSGEASRGDGDRSDSEPWPMQALVVANIAVLEEFFYSSYKNIPSFDAGAYLEKIFTSRFSVAPLFYLPGLTEASQVSPASVQLWRSIAFEAARPWADVLAREVNYGALGNLRLHARLRAMCDRLWTVEAPESDIVAVRQARILVLTAVFPEFCTHIALYEGRWPGFINRLSERWQKPGVEVPTNPIYRHIDEPDLLTVLQDLSAIEYIGRAPNLPEHFRLSGDGRGMSNLAKELMEISQWGF